MKKLIYLIVAFAVAFQACKKETNVSTINKSGFYPIGTVVNLSTNFILPRDSTSSQLKADKQTGSIKGKTSYIPGYSTTWYVPYASGDYFPGETVARSFNNVYRLEHQADANLVLYNSSNQALWASGNSYGGSFMSRVRFQLDGNFVHIYDVSTGYVTWSAGVSAGPNPIWILQDDGNLVGYSNHINNGNGTITITGSPFGSTGTAGGKKSSRYGKIR